MDARAVAAMKDDTSSTWKWKTYKAAGQHLRNRRDQDNKHTGNPHHSGKHNPPSSTSNQQPGR